MKHIITKDLAMGCCIVGLAMTVLASLATGQVITPPDNCHCGPVDDCDGIPMQHSTYCPDLGHCSCILYPNPQGTCLVGIEAYCNIPAGP